jgi:hypothetical protein
MVGKGHRFGFYVSKEEDPLFQIARDLNTMIGVAEMRARASPEPIETEYKRNWLCKSPWSNKITVPVVNRLVKLIPTGRCTKMNREITLPPQHMREVEKVSEHIDPKCNLRR